MSQKGEIASFSENPKEKNGLFYESERGHLTLSEYLEQVKRVIDKEFSDTVWVVAEVNEIRNDYPNGHCYIDLIETEKDGNVTAASRATIWKSLNDKLTPKFRQATGGDIRKGIKILIRVRATFHVKHGFSLQIRDIDPNYTLGDLEVQRRLTLERVEREGLIGLQKELAFPSLPCRIAVVSGGASAGYQDFIQHLKDSGISFKCDLYESLMQGEEAPKEIAATFARINRADYDVVVFIRGGGSDLDLACFDDYLVAKAIACCPIPVISGIGHEKDWHICDVVAAVRVKTPTGAADYIVGLFAQEAVGLSNLQGRLSIAIGETIEAKSQYIGRLTLRLEKSITSKIGEGLLLLNNLEHRVSRGVEAIVANEERRVTFLATTLEKGFSSKIQEGVGYLRELKERIFGVVNNRISSQEFNLEMSSGALEFLAERVITREGAFFDGLCQKIFSLAAGKIERERGDLRLFESGLFVPVARELNNADHAVQILETQLLSADPRRILKMGYSLVFANNERVKSISQIKENSRVRILVSDGDAEFNVTSLKSSISDNS